MTTQPSPLVPRPIVGVMALALTAALLGNIYLDSQPGEYSGAQANYLLALLIGGVLGIDITRGLIKRSRDEDEPKDAP